MWKAVIVDRDYGSVSLERQEYIRVQYEKNRIALRLEHYATPEEILQNCQDADVILGTGNPPITRAVLEGLPKLKLVQRFGIGVDSIDLETAKKQGILVLNMPGFCVDELALHATAMILNLLRNVSYYDRGIRKGEWRKAKGHLPRNPKDMTLGLYGFGGSARPLYNIFRNGFGSKIITHDPYLDTNIKGDYDVEVVTFEELLKNSDIISIHAPLTEETRLIFNKDAFRKMKDDSMIINIARGELIHQGDLIQALEKGYIRFAGLDVFEKEPLPITSPLIENENAVLSCHSAFYGDHALENQLKLAVDLVYSVLNNHCVAAKFIVNKGVVSRIENFVVM